MRKIFTLLILLLLLPVTALAEEGAPNTLYVGDKGLSVANDSYWTTDANGKLTQSAADQSWNVKYDPSTATLTLSGATIQGGNNTGSVPYGAGIYALCSQDQPVALTIELIGTNTITGYYGIFLNAEIDASSYGTNATLTITGENNGSLGVSGFNYGIYVKSGTGNASLNIENVAVTSSTNGNSAAGVYVMSSTEANVSPNLSLAVNGGSLTANGTGSSDGIQFYVGDSSATNDTTSLTVSENAIVRANGGIKAYHVDEPTPSGTGIVFDGTEGTVYGDVTLDESLTINQGETLTIPEGSSLDMGGNEITVASGGKLEGTPTGSGTVKIAPTITTESLPEGTVGTAYNQLLGATGSETITWSLASGTLPTGLKLSDDGKITGTPATEGSSTFTVKAENSAGSATQEYTLKINPTPTVSVTGVKLNQSELSLFTGGSETLTATVEPSNATNKNVTWQSDNANVATVDANGKVTAVGEGNATITVTTEDGSKTATCTVTVTVPVTGVKLNKETLELFTDGSENLTATVEPGNATNKALTWSTSDNTVATVDENGTVTAVGAGEATITATAGGITATCVVHVRKPATVEASGSTNLSFTTDRNEFTLTATVHAQGNDLNPKDGSWTWTVADADVVALSGSPTWRSQSYSISRQAFTIEGTGTTTITAIYDDGTYRGSVDFKVRISKPSPPDPISYYNIYVEDVCDGVEVSTSKQVVREGGSINVYVEKDTARYTFDNFKVYYKRSYYGTWDELKEGTQPGEYPIKNIWTHIYIKAEGAEEKEDPTGIESIEGVKVYTKDGSLYVQTPQREQVIIVSMSGAVVKNEEQIGLKQYHGLQPGIYIVRVGDRAYKVRLN